MKPELRTFALSLLAAVAVLVGATIPAYAADKKPNIVHLG